MFNQKISNFSVPLSLKSLFQDRSNIAVLILAIASYFIFFWKLDAGGIRQWDESSLAINALEMALNGNPIVKYMGGEIDLINTKPPLVIWFIVGCMKIFGYTEFSLRLPSAICAAATVAIVYGFSQRYLKDSLVASISSFVLITSIGFTGEHVARTGDYDAMLVLWITIYSLSYFLFLESNKEREKTLFLTVTTVALILAVWTKGIAGLLVLPGLLIYSLYKKKLTQLLLSPRVYYSAFIFIILSLSYYLLREVLSPGFLKAVIENELTGRYMDVVPGGTQRGFLYYLKGMISYRFVPWIYLLPACLVFSFMNQLKAVRNFSVFALIDLVFYFSIISCSRTKFEWYDAPLYPVAALAVGLGIATVLTVLLTSFNQSRSFKRTEEVRFRDQTVILCSLVLLCIFFMPFMNNLYEVYRDIPFRQNDKRITDSALSYRNYLTQMRNTELDLASNSIRIMNIYRYNLPLLFYVEAAEINQPYSFDLEWMNPSSQTFRSSDVIINCDSSFRQEVQDLYVTRTLHQSSSCETLLIERRKA